MNKFLLYSLAISLVFTACKNSEKAKAESPTKAAMVETKPVETIEKSQELSKTDEND